MITKTTQTIGTSTSLLLVPLLFFYATALYAANITLENITPSFIRHPVDSAYIITMTLQDAEKKAYFLSQIAKEYVANDDINLAIEIGLDVQKNFANSSAAALIFPEIGAALAKKGNRAESIMLLNALKDNPARNLTVEYTVLTYIQLKQLDMAQGFIREIDSTTKKNRLTLALAEAYAKDGFFQKAESLLKDIPNSYSKNQSLFEIGEYAAQSQQLARAKLLMTQITDAELASQGLARIVEIDSKSQDLQETLQIANSIIHPKYRNRALGYVAGYYAKNRMFASALELAESLSGESKDIAYAQIAIAYASIGEVGNIDKMIGQINTAELKNRVAIALAQHYVEDGNYDKAVEVIQNISNPNDRDQSMIQLGELLGSTKQFHYVQLLMRQFKPDRVKNEAFSKYTTAFVRHAAVSRVIRVTQDITDPTLRNATLSTVADYYLNTGQYPGAKQAIAEISQVGQKHKKYMEASIAAQRNKNTAVSQEFLNITLDTTVGGLPNPTAKALAWSEVATQLAKLQQQEEAKKLLEKAYDLIRTDRNWTNNFQAVESIANSFIITDDPVTAYQIVMRLPKLEDQITFLLQAPNESQTPNSEKKRRAVLRELARAAQLRPKTVTL